MASALYQPQRRAARYVAPLYAGRDHRQGRRGSAKPDLAVIVQPLLRRNLGTAFERGRNAGLMDKHYLPYLALGTSSEWLEFLRGHREGQAILHAEQEREKAAAYAEALQ